MKPNSVPAQTCSPLLSKNTKADLLTEVNHDKSHAILTKTRYVSQVRRVASQSWEKSDN